MHSVLHFIGKAVGLVILREPIAVGFDKVVAKGYNIVDRKLA
jgi:hypothetical protein